jgi:hypothetical protein
VQSPHLGKLKAASYQEGFVDGIVLIVDKLPDPNPGSDIHIQTVYPTL